MGSSGWAVERFGKVADELARAVPRAILLAHTYAAAAQGVSGTRHLDPYGHTLKNRQHECLVDEAMAIEGFEKLQPRGVPFELVRLVHTRVILFPWRYAANGKTSRLRVRMKPSGFRRGLLAGPDGPGDQLTLEHAELTEAEIEAQFAEEKAVWDQLRTLARVVTVAYASNPNGIIDLGWGEIELLNDDGTIRWLHWEPLAWKETKTADQADGTPHLPAASTPGAHLRPPGPRFDDLAEPDDDLALRPRTSPGEPRREVEPPAQETGTDTGPSDDPH